MEIWVIEVHMQEVMMVMERKFATRNININDMSWNEINWMQEMNQKSEIKFSEKKKLAFLQSIIIFRPGNLCL